MTDRVPAVPVHLRIEKDGTVHKETVLLKVQYAPVEFNADGSIKRDPVSLAYDALCRCNGANQQAYIAATSGKPYQEKITAARQAFEAWVLAVEATAVPR